METTTNNDRRTIKQAAEILRVHPNSVRNLIARGDLKAERIGKSIIRIRQADIDALFTPYVPGEFGVWAS